MMLIDFSSRMAAILVSSVDWLVDKTPSIFEYEVGTSRYWSDVSASKVTSYIAGPPLFIWWVPLIDISLLSSSIVLLSFFFLLTLKDIGKHIIKSESPLSFLENDLSIELSNNSMPHSKGSKWHRELSYSHDLPFLFSKHHIEGTRLLWLFHIPKSFWMMQFIVLVTFSEFQPGEIGNGPRPLLFFIVYSVRVFPILYPKTKLDFPWYD